MNRVRIIANHLGAQDVCIVAVGRSPILRSFDAFYDVTEADLAGQTLEKTLARYKIEASNIQEFYLGKVFTSNTGQALPKQILFKAGVPDSISQMSVNKACASGMKALSLGFLSITSGNANCVLAGGVENMSRIPYLLNLRKGIQTRVIDSLNYDGLPDAVTGEPPIIIADVFNRKHGYTRQALDEYAKLSCQRAKEAKLKNKFEFEAVEIQHPKSKKLIKEDFIRDGKGMENARAVNKDGYNTAMNSCGLSDGASFVIMCSREKAAKEGWKVLASVLSYADAEQHARDFPSTPTLATEKALKVAGLTVSQIDYMEINEPFACVVLHNSKSLNFPINKINIYGGAISIGHPVGSSGCRIVGTLVNVLHQENGKYGVASICNAGGGGSALVLKKE